LRPCATPVNIPAMDVARAMIEAVEHHRAGRIAEAEALYRQVIAVDPNNPDAHNNLGEIARQSSKLTAAVESYQTALRINPNFAAAHSNLGLALAALGDAYGAIAALREAVRINPNYAEAHQHLGHALGAQDRHEEALHHFAI